MGPPALPRDEDGRRRRRHSLRTPVVRPALNRGATMARMKNGLTIASFCVLAMVSLAHAETFRCGRWIVTGDMTLSELTKKCGAPASRTSSKRDVRVYNNRTGFSPKVGESTIE